MDPSDAEARVVGIIGIITSILVMLAHVPTFYSICKNKSIGEFHCFPHILNFFGALVWIYYASHLDNELLIDINIIRVVIATVYIIIFLWYATTKMSIIWQLLGNSVVVRALVLIAQLVLKNEATRVKFLGWACVIYSIAAFVAPLIVIVSLLPSHNNFHHTKTKSVEFMLFFLFPLLLTIINAVMWFVYGSLLKDLYIQIPNFLGILFGTAQLVRLYMAYHKSEKAVPEHASEMTRSSGTGNNHIEATTLSLSKMTQELKCQGMSFNDVA